MDFAHYPYISTAVWHGKWATHAMGEPLLSLLHEYKVNISARGGWKCELDCEKKCEVKCVDEYPA